MNNLDELYEEYYSKRAFEKLSKVAFKRFSRSVYDNYLGFVTREVEGDRETAADIIQKVLFKIYLKGDKIFNINSYLQVVFRNRSIDFHRSMRNIVKQPIDEGVLNIIDEKLLDMREHDIAVLIKAFNKILSPRQLEVFLLYYEEKSYKEISQSLRIKESTVKTTLKVARSKIKNWISDNEDFKYLLQVNVKRK